MPHTDTCSVKDQHGVSSSIGIMKFWEPELVIKSCLEHFYQLPPYPVFLSQKLTQSPDFSLEQRGFLYLEKVKTYDEPNN